HIPADVVLVAYGYEPPKLTQVDEFSELAFDDRGFLIVDSDLMTNLPGVFAGGSVVRGSVPLVTIVHDSCSAAASIARYLCARRAKAGLVQGALADGAERPISAGSSHRPFGARSHSWPPCGPLWTGLALRRNQLSDELDICHPHGFRKRR